MKTKTIIVYRYSELTDEAKQRAREWYLSAGSEYDDAWDSTLEDAKNIGLIIEQIGQHHANRGHFERYAENTAERIMKEHGKMCETYKTAKRFLDARKALLVDENGDMSLYDEDKAEELEKEFLHDILEDYRVLHEMDIEYRESEESISEAMEANEYEFDKNGKRV